MAASLPPKASVEQLKNQAKDILSAHKSGDPSCCGVLRNLHPFKDKPDKAILEAEVGLQRVQFALAMVYGFDSWERLSAHVEGKILPEFNQAIYSGLWGDLLYRYARGKERARAPPGFGRAGSGGG